MSQPETTQPQYISAAPMQQTPTTSTTVTEQTDRASAPDRAPLGLRGGLDYDHPGTGLLNDIFSCFLCCQCMDDCCTMLDDTLCCG